MQIDHNQIVRHTVKKKKKFALVPSDVRMLRLLHQLRGLASAEANVASEFCPLMIQTLFVLGGNDLPLSFTKNLKTRLFLKGKSHIH